jgi:hypothetical protein
MKVALRLLVVENVGLKLQLTFEACRRTGIVAVSARQLKPIKITDVEVNN